MAEGRRSRTASLALLLGLFLPAAGGAEVVYTGQEAVPGCCNGHYSRLTYWAPVLHRCLAKHRGVSVSVYPPPEAYAPTLSSSPVTTAPSVPPSKENPEKMPPPSTK